MAAVKNIRMTPKVMRLLTLLEKGPKYGRQFTLIAPELFFSSEQISTSGERVAPVANIYSLLKSAKDAGLIEEMKDYQPTIEPDELEKSPTTMRKYYCISVKGREALIRARKTIDPDGVTY